MHRRPLLQLLARYSAAYPSESGVIARVQTLVETEPRCFERDCYTPGHITASCWILDSEGERVLLTHHRKLDRWLQLGGHADGEHDVPGVALREAREESGMVEFVPVPAVDPSGLFDLDVHVIPARADEPAHEHHDVRFLLRAKPAQGLVRSEESIDLRWFAPEELAALDLDASVLRLRQKADTWLATARAATA